MFSFVRTNRQTDSHNKDKQLNVLKGASKTNPSALSFFFLQDFKKSFKFLDSLSFNLVTNYTL